MNIIIEIIYIYIYRERERERERVYHMKGMVYCGSERRKFRPYNYV